MNWIQYDFTEIELCCSCGESFHIFESDADKVYTCPGCKQKYRVIVKVEAIAIEVEG